MNSISTFGLNSMVLDAAQRLQSAAATKEVQEASGLVGQTYGDLGSQSQYLISLENEVSQATTWASNAGTASNRVQAMYSAVGLAFWALRTSTRWSIAPFPGIRLARVMEEMADRAPIRAATGAMAACRPFSRMTCESSPQSMRGL